MALLQTTGPPPLIAKHFDPEPPLDAGKSLNIV